MNVFRFVFLSRQVLVIISKDSERVGEQNERGVVGKRADGEVDAGGWC